MAAGASSATRPARATACRRWPTSGGVRATVVRAQDLAVEAVDLLETQAPGPELARAYATLAQLIMVGGHDHHTAVAVGKRAVELGGQLGEEQVVVHALNTVGTAEVLHGGQQRLGEARGEPATSPCRRPPRRRRPGPREPRRRSPARSATTSEPSITSPRRCATRPCTISTCSGVRLAYAAEVALELGRWDDVEDVASTRARARTAPRQHGPGAALTVLGRLRARRGDPDPRRLLDEALAVALPQGDLLVVCPLRAARAEAAWLAGDPPRRRPRPRPGSRSCSAMPAPGGGGSWRSGAGRRPARSVVPMAAPSRTGCRWTATSAGPPPRGPPSAARYQQALALADSADEGELRHALATCSTPSARARQRRWPPPGCARMGARSHPSRAAPADPRQPSRAHRHGSWRCSCSWPTACATQRSPSGSCCPRRPSTTTCRRCSPSWACRTARRQPARRSVLGLQHGERDAPKIGSASRCGAGRVFVPSADDQHRCAGRTRRPRLEQ